MKLSALMAAVVANEKANGNGHNEYAPVFNHTAETDPDICSIHYRSQTVQPGGLFVAVPGHRADGHDYIEDAMERGAVAAVVQRVSSHEGIFLKVPDTRQALAQISAAFYSHPSEALSVIGVTGTNGKTTVTYLVESILTAAGLSPGVIGTVNCRYAGMTQESPVTTPESLDLQRLLFQMKTAGVTHVIMEVSSHAIDLFRVASCRFDIGAFTNLSQDHLDYHRTMEAYWACKRRFFTEYLQKGPKAKTALAVVNTDNHWGDDLLAVLHPAAGRVPISYGHRPNSDVRPLTVSVEKTGIQGELMTPAGPVGIQSRLVGGHNLENILCAVSIGVGLALPVPAIEKGILNVSSIPGRLEQIWNDAKRFVYVDYAHTPDALENVLKTLHAISDQRIICVFGCGGDRDAEKRPQMGRIAGKWCDVTVITSDNPRTESVTAIIEQILTGIQQTASKPIAADEATAPGKGYLVLPDRREAITWAIRVATPGDMVLVAGKGHETYQIIGTEKRPFDDRIIAREALLALEERTN